MKRIDLALLVGLVAAIFLSSFTSFARDCDDVRQNVVRLHILANSDSETDQNLKLAVRDKILTETSDLFSKPVSKAEVEKTALNQLKRIEQIAEEEVTRQGFDYDVSAELVNMFFESRSYGETSMPVGRYDAIRVKIGSAKGKNWWCVLFPPMCIPAASEKTPMEKQISELGKQPRFVPKLAALELVEKIVRNKADHKVKDTEIIKN